MLAAHVLRPSLHRGDHHSVRLPRSVHLACFRVRVERRPNEDDRWRRPWSLLRGRPASIRAPRQSGLDRTRFGERPPAPHPARPPARTKVQQFHARHPTERHRRQETSRPWQRSAQSCPRDRRSTQHNRLGYGGKSHRNPYGMGEFKSCAIRVQGGVVLGCDSYPRRGTSKQFSEKVTATIALRSLPPATRRPITDR